MEERVTQRFANSSKLNRIFLAVLAVAVVAGITTGFTLAKKNSGGSLSGVLVDHPKTAQQDNRTFRDFAEGTIQKKPEDKNTDYGEGTHLLVREVGIPVALTSSVVDLSEYEGKKVKVFGETQKGNKEAWFMDVGKIEEK